ncbi:MAG: SDR family oxidoreductase [Gracilibacteraceae bacterium]|jgi:3-oxoacyl-[acyl-carrier protein] reductase|nr:SDR family oxidoreductase [Gracilibacteraceae bacterium]
MLKGKTALITGGGTGIGRATALRLARAGAAIAVNYSRSAQEAEETRREIEGLGAVCRLYRADVSDDAAVRAMMAQAVADFGGLDILVNNAGRTHFILHEDLEEMKAEYWDEVFAVNVKGLFFCCRAAAAALRQSRGVIVNITSIAGLNGLGSSLAYSASKAAAISVTKSLARVLAPEVRVIGVAPGIVTTRWVKGHEDHVERLAGSTPLGRPAGPEDIAEAAYGLIVHGGFITGQNIVVDGGAFI